MLISPLTGSHDRAGFACGRADLDDWLKQIARQHQDKGLSKTFVATLETQPNRICAYYALALTEVDTRTLPETHRKRLPRMIPGIRLGRLAVDHDYQRRHLGELMLFNAIERTQRIREHAGVVGLFVDAIDTHAVQFHARYGFEAFTDDPLRLFLPVR